MKVFLMGLMLIFGLVGAKEVDYNDLDSWGEECQGGERQTPIDIDSRSAKVCPDNIWFHFEAPCEQFSFVGDGQAYVVPAENLNYITLIEGKDNINIQTYYSAQFHFHHPSEHEINGKLYDLELHLVHFRKDLTEEEQTETLEKIRAAGTNVDEATFGATEDILAVLGIIFEIKDVEEDVFDSLLPQEEGDMSNLNEAFSCIKGRFFYHYKGSLTTPDCGEVVNWFLLRDPLPIRQQNFDKIMAQVNDGNANNRPIQDLNDREVYLLSEEYCWNYWGLLEEQL